MKLITESKKDTAMEGMLRGYWKPGSLNFFLVLTAKSFKKIQSRVKTHTFQ